MLHTFRHGVHPDYMKAPEAGITAIKAPAEVILPCSQHIGAPAEPVVKVGDRVKMGTLVADSAAPVSAPVHSPVSGTVKAVEKRPHPLGGAVLSVVIENDYRDETDYMPPLTEEEMHDPEAVVRRIRDAGIVGLGGAMFPTAFKIRSGLGKVDTLIINGAECEPYLNGDHLTMLNYPEELLKGAELARIACRTEKAFYGIEVNKKDAIALLESKNPGKYGVEIVPEAVKYPQGGEKMQIKAVTGREVPPGGLPASVGCTVISTRTCYAIYEACCLGKPLIERIVTVAGSAMAGPVNALTRLGTPLGFIAEQCGGFVREPKKIVLGGPMMGICASTLEAPNIKGTAGVLFFTEDEEKPTAQSQCIHCGRCISVCPMNLEPMFMYMFYRKKDLEGLEKYHVTDCFECGSCSFSCPAALPLTEAFHLSKGLLKQMQSEAKSASGKAGS